MSREKHHPVLQVILTASARGDLSTVHSVMANILAVFDNEKASASDLANAFERDTAGTAHLLRDSNAALYATINEIKIDNREDALLRVGFHRAFEIIMSATVCRLFRKGIRAGSFSLDALWENSVAVAICNRLFLKILI